VFIDVLLWAVTNRLLLRRAHPTRMRILSERSESKGFPLSSLESTLARNTPVTHPESTLTKSLDLKPRRINTYEKRPVSGCADPAKVRCLDSGGVHRTPATGDRHPARPERSRGERAERAEGSPLPCCAPFVPERSNLPTFKRSNSLRSLP
jgi:hypothetical protein